MILNTLKEVNLSINKMGRKQDIIIVTIFIKLLPKIIPFYFLQHFQSLNFFSSAFLSVSFCQSIYQNLVLQSTAFLKVQDLGRKGESKTYNTAIFAYKLLTEPKNKLFLYYFLSCFFN